MPELPHTLEESQPHSFSQEENASVTKIDTLQNDLTHSGYSQHTSLFIWLVNCP